MCSHIVKCYSVASQFEGCREKIQEIPAIVKDISRILYYKVRKKFLEIKCLVPIGSCAFFCPLYCFIMFGLIIGLFVYRTFPSCAQWWRNVWAPSLWTSGYRPTCSSVEYCGICCCTCLTMITRLRRGVWRRVENLINRSVTLLPWDGLNLISY